MRVEEPEGYVPSIDLSAPDTDEDRDLARPVVRQRLNAFSFRKAPPCQWRAFVHRMSPSAMERGDVEITGIFGGWGSGKTSALARKFVQLCIEHGHSSVYGHGDNPTSAIIAPTYKILKQATMRAVEELLEDGLIIRRRGHPENSITWANGHKTLMLSGEAELEGLSLTHVGIDELQHPAFSHRKWLNYLARARDSRVRRLAVVACGLPESTWLRDVFDKPQTDAQLTLLAATRDNPYITPARLERFLDNCPSGDEKRLLEGEWMPPIGAIYPQFNPRVHLIDRLPITGELITLEAMARRPAFISFDVGNLGCVLVFVEIDVLVRGITGHVVGRERGLLCVAEMLPEGLSVDAACLMVKTRTPFDLVPGVSKIMTDPKTDRDELASLRRHFPGVAVVQRARGDDTYPVEIGINRTARALCDALGNTRLYFWRGIGAAERGVLNSIARYKRNPLTGDPVKDNLHDHQVDALRYAVAELLPAEPRAAPRSLRG